MSNRELMNKNPAISVVCPTYNSEDFIGDTLRSVFSQSYRPVEIVVVDDGSSDNTTTVVRTLADEFDEVELILLTNSHRGPGAARNAGVRAASCTWIAFIDSDDLWNEKKLEYLAEEIKCNPDCNFFCHNEHEIDMLGNSRGILDYLAMYNSAVDIPGQLYKRNLFSTSAVVCRRNLLLEYGLFDETLMSIQDYELWLRLSPNINVHFIDAVLGEYRVRAGNITQGLSWPRLRNQMKVLWRHRLKTGFVQRYLRITRALLSFVKNLLLSCVCK